MNNIKHNIVSNLLRISGGIVRRLPCMGGGWLQTSLVRRSARMGRYELSFTFSTNIPGIIWSAAAFPDLLVRYMLFVGSYQDDVLFALAAFARPGSTVLDVGGHHGLMAIVAAKAVGPTGRVVSFEPNPAARKYFEQNMALNHISNILIEPIGLSDHAGEASFFMQRGTASWNSSLFEQFIAPGYETEEMTVPIKTMDQYIEETGIVPSLIKIDIEGSEFLALQGALDSIRKHHPVLIMEFNPVAAEAAGTTIGKIVAFLQKESYCLMVFKKDKWRRHSRSSWEDFDENKHCRDDLANVVCLPAGSELQGGKREEASGKHGR